MLVDLAGSENSAKSGTLSNDSRLREGGNINKSLSTLGRVVQTLVTRKPSDQHIPYRDSKLTLILQESLNGRSKAAFIMTINPAREHLAETLSTLRFGQNAKRVVTNAKVNKVMTLSHDEKDALIQR